MRERIRLDTMKDIESFVSIVSRIPEMVYLTNDSGLRVSAKSLLGAIYTMEWDSLYCECDRPIDAYIKDFLIIDGDK